jgi:hypothetical protein
LKLFTFFVNKPDMIYLVALIFLLAYVSLLGWKKKQRYVWPMLLLSLLWFAEGLWESYCVSIRADIRVDLIFLIPFSLIANCILLVHQIFLLCLRPKKQSRWR